MLALEGLIQNVGNRVHRNNGENDEAHDGSWQGDEAKNTNEFGDNHNEQGFF